MWFKTRVGLCHVAEASEILVTTNDIKPKRWWISVRNTYQQEAAFKSFLGNGTFKNTFTYLAMFSDSPTVGDAIAECMGLIEASLRAKDEVCDLSQSGDVPAWKGSWNHIAWPSRGRG